MDYEAALETTRGEGFFPNRKVIGGIDLVGRNYDAGSHEFDKQIPKPDQNPLINFRDQLALKNLPVVVALLTQRHRDRKCAPLPVIVKNQLSAAAWHELYWH